jgi:hypothetical protein
MSQTNSLLPRNKVILLHKNNVFMSSPHNSYPKKSQYIKIQKPKNLGHYLEKKNWLKKKNFPKNLNFQSLNQTKGFF